MDYTNFLTGAHIIAEADSREAMATFVAALMTCGHAHNFAVLLDEGPYGSIMTTQTGIDCMQKAFNDPLRS